MAHSRWPDQFADDPALLAAADQIDAEARGSDPGRVVALAVTLSALRPEHVVADAFMVDAAGLLRLAEEVQRILAGGDTQ